MTIKKKTSKKKKTLNRKITERKKLTKKKIIKIKNDSFKPKQNFDLSYTVKPLIDFQNILDTAIIPLNSAKSILDKTIEPILKIDKKLLTDIPNLISLSNTVNEQLKPLADIKLTLDETVKPIIELSGKIDQSLIPLKNIGVKLNTNFPNLINLTDIVNDQLKPLADIKLTLDETVKPITELSNRITNQLEPLNIIQLKDTELIKPFTDNLLKLEDRLQLINTDNIKITEKLKPLLDFSKDFLIEPFEIIPTKPLVNFAQNLEIISSQVNKELLGNQINYYGTAELEEVEKPKKKSRKKIIKEFIKKLKDSESSWSEFEDVCKEIFCQCFMPELEEPLVQSFTEDKIHRRDLIFYIPHDLGGFWQFLIFKFGMGIVIDCKNHVDPLDGNEVRIASKYLGKKKLTTFGIIASRKGLSENGKKVQRDLWVNSDHLVICLTEKDLIKMLELKEAGDEPWKVIDLLMKDFHSSD